MGRLVVEGILYPPQPTGSIPSTVRHACEEFTRCELDQLIADVVGIPVCIEHDTSRIVGTVSKAHRTASNAIWVTFTVEGDTADAVTATKAVNDGTMCGLSLSHSYVFDGKHSRAERSDLSLDSRLRPGDVAHKTTRELSLCVDPARAGCHIHLVHAEPSIIAGQMDGSSAGASRIAGIVRASAMQSDASPPLSAPTDAPQPPGISLDPNWRSDCRCSN